MREHVLTGMGRSNWGVIYIDFEGDVVRRFLAEPDLRSPELNCILLDNPHHIPPSRHLTSLGHQHWVCTSLGCLAFRLRRCHASPTRTEAHGDLCFPRHTVASRSPVKDLHRIIKLSPTMGMGGKRGKKQARTVAKVGYAIVQQPSCWLLNSQCLSGTCNL